MTEEGDHWMITSPHTKTHSISQMICHYDWHVCAVALKWENILLSTPHHCGGMTSVSLSQKVSADPRLLFLHKRDWECSVLHFQRGEKCPVATEDSLKPDYKFSFPFDLFCRNGMTDRNIRIMQYYQRCDLLGSVRGSICCILVQTTKVQVYSTFRYHPTHHLSTMISCFLY